MITQTLRSGYGVACAARSAACSTPLLVAHCSAALSASLAHTHTHTHSLPSVAPAHTRGYQTITRRRRKELARKAASETRALLEFAKQFDPMRTARMTVSHTLTRLGWEHHEQEMISDGLIVDFTMKDSYCAFEIVPAERYVDTSHPDASTVPAVDTSTSVRTDAAGKPILAFVSPFPAAPKVYENPLIGKVLDKATAARHALIRSKGWSLVVIPAPLWQVACAKPNQHYARRDLITSLTLPLAPFENRPVNAQPGSTAGTRASAASGEEAATPTKAAPGAKKRTAPPPQSAKAARAAAAAAAAASATPAGASRATAELR